jgi:hypothetical protein
MNTRDFAEETLDQTPSDLKEEMQIFLEELVSIMETKFSNSDKIREIVCSVELEEYLHSIGFPSLTH